jgi:hypothetical protein
MISVNDEREAEESGVFGSKGSPALSNDRFEVEIFGPQVLVVHPPFFNAYVELQSHLAIEEDFNVAFRR